MLEKLNLEKNQYLPMEYSAKDVPLSHASPAQNNGVKNCLLASAIFNVLFIGALVVGGVFLYRSHYTICRLQVDKQIAHFKGLGLTYRIHGCDVTPEHKARKIEKGAMAESHNNVWVNDENDKKGEQKPLAESIFSHSNGHRPPISFPMPPKPEMKNMMRKEEGKINDIAKDFYPGGMDEKENGIPKPPNLNDIYDKIRGKFNRY
ncbi:uncharacterized protein LOC144425708 [Styela clava]